MTRKLDRLDKKIGATIRLARTRLGLNQAALGDALGVTSQQVQKYENGTNAIASTRIPALCKALKITPNALFSLVDTLPDEVLGLSAWGVRMTLDLQRLSLQQRTTIHTIVHEMRTDK